jgi:hypothetical protein
MTKLSTQNPIYRLESCDNIILTNSEQNSIIFQFHKLIQNLLLYNNAI